MKSLRNIGLALAVAFGACASAVARAVEPLVGPLVRLVVKICDEMACGVARLKRELTYQYGSAPMLSIGVGAGLTPEGHGYRQTSASDIGARRTPLTI